MKHLTPVDIAKVVVKRAKELMDAHDMTTHEAWQYWTEIKNTAEDWQRKLTGQGQGR